MIEQTPRTPAVRIRVEQGRRIRDLRKFKKLSQEAVAEQVGVTKAAVSDWERGVSSPRDVHQVAVAKALGCPWSTLFQPPTDVAA